MAAAGLPCSARQAHEWFWHPMPAMLDASGPRAFEHGDEQEAQRCEPHGNGVGLQFAHAEQVHLIVADVVKAELFG